jgi:hypothetical protein
MLTGVWYSLPAGDFDFSCLPAAGEFASYLTGKWIWADREAAAKAPAGTVYFRKKITLEAVPEDALAVVTCDNSYMLFVNGKSVASGKDFNVPQLVNLKSHLKTGENMFAIKAVNNLPDNKTPPEDKPIPESAANPAGLYFSARLKLKGATVSFGTDQSWVWSRQKSTDWETSAFVDDDWTAAAELGDAKTAPWKAEAALAGAFAGTTLRGHVRAALVNSDPLMVSLGRPSREQVITTRPSTATTLQALELTNGETLAKVLQQGAAKVVAERSASPKELVTTLYRKALGRTPSRQELALARELLGESVKKDAVEDLVWSLAMLPEFQLIY